MDTTFTKPYDAAILALGVLRRLDSGKVATFEDRLRSQKVQYIAQVFGISPVYQFSLYIHGPYSPELTKDIFLAHESKIDIPAHPFVSEALEEQFGKLGQFIADKSTRQLELIATYHWLTKCAGQDSEKAEKTLGTWKKADEAEIRATVLAVKKQLP